MLCFSLFILSSGFLVPFAPRVHSYVSKGRSLLYSDREDDLEKKHVVSDLYQKYNFNEYDSLAIESSFNEQLKKSDGDDLLKQSSNKFAPKVESPQIIDFEMVDGQMMQFSTKIPFKTQIQNLKMNDVTFELKRGSTVEIMHDGRLEFGIVESRRPTSWNVTLSSGESAFIDEGQILSVWNDVSEIDMPKCPKQWAEIANEALKSLQGFRSNIVTLKEFWHIAIQRGRRYCVDSLDVAVYLFQKSKFIAWFDNTIATDSSGVYAPTAAQRYLAARLLNKADIYFKRSRSQRAEPWQIRKYLESIDADKKEIRNVMKRYIEMPSDTILDVEGDIDQHQSEYISGCGYRIRDECTTRTRQVQHFVAYYHAIKALVNGTMSNSSVMLQKQDLKSNDGAFSNATEIFPPLHISINQKILEIDQNRHNCISSLLRWLEMYCMQNPQRNSQAKAPRIVHQIMLALSLPETVSSAREILSNLQLVDSIEKVDQHNNRISPLHPWSSLVTHAVAQLKEYVEKRSTERDMALASTAKTPAGKRGTSGRFDYTAIQEYSPPICIDEKSTELYDDAMQYCPDTNEILVHVVDVVQNLQQFKVLEDTAAERLQTVYLGTGTIPMLPYSCSQHLKLSTTHTNEVITVAFKLNTTTGEIMKTRVFPALIGPVVPVAVTLADSILLGDPTVVDINGTNDSTGEVSDVDSSVRIYSSLESVTKKANTLDHLGIEKSRNLGISDGVVRSLRHLYRSVHAIAPHEPWISSSFTGNYVKQQRYDKRTGEFDVRFVEATPSRTLVSSLLSLYSNATYEYCNYRFVATPTVMKNRLREGATPDHDFDNSLGDNEGDLHKSFSKFKLWDSRVIRYATAPLRDWMSYVQQRQVRGALTLDIPLSRIECGDAVIHYNTYRKKELSYNNQVYDDKSIDLIQSHYRQETEKGNSLVVDFETTKSPGLVNILKYRLIGRVINLSKEDVKKLQGRGIARVTKVSTGMRVVSLAVMDKNSFIDSTPYPTTFPD